MYFSIDMHRRDKGFTLLEVMIAVTISSLIALGAWSVYVMGSAWSKQFMPRIEAQRIARITVKTIVYGLTDIGAGTDSISGVSYSRRNGIAWATALPTNTSSSSVEKITYDLKGLSGQSFFMLKTEDPMKLYHNNVSYPISGTTGLTGLSFNMTSPNIVTVTATVEKDVNVGNQAPYHVKADLNQTVYLRNI